MTLELGLVVMRVVDHLDGGECYVYLHSDGIVWLKGSCVECVHC